MTTVATLQPGHFWKTPFFWEPGCPGPAAGQLSFGPVDDAWLADAVARVMASSIDESDVCAVADAGPAAAAAELLGIAPQYFDLRPGWWRRARDADGVAVGFVLPVLLRGDKAQRDGKPEGTIFYMGVLPDCRGRGHGRALLDEATRIFMAAGCWRVFCDASSANGPMVAAFRAAGYTERSPWQRPLR